MFSSQQVPSSEHRGSSARLSALVSDRSASPGPLRRSEKKGGGALSPNRRRERPARRQPGRCAFRRNTARGPDPSRRRNNGVAQLCSALPEVQRRRPALPQHTRWRPPSSPRSDDLPRHARRSGRGGDNAAVYDAHKRTPHRTPTPGSEGRRLNHVLTRSGQKYSAAEYAGRLPSAPSVYLFSVHDLGTASEFTGFISGTAKRPEECDAEYVGRTPNVGTKILLSEASMRPS